MRRPSWNKSQAIQQVISLKALLEGHGDDDAGAKTLRKIVAENPEPRVRILATVSLNFVVFAFLREAVAKERVAWPLVFFGRIFRPGGVV